MTLSVRRLFFVFASLIFVGSIAVSPFLISRKADAVGQITDRSLTLKGVGTVGGSQAGGTVDHLFTFTLPSVGNASVGSILFQYCTLAAGSCSTPHGLDTTGISIGPQTGATGFTNLTATTNGAPYIARASASPIPAGTPVSYQLLGVINPDGLDTTCPAGAASNNCTFFVRISTYLSLNASGTAIDAGTVAASTATQIVVSGVMPESLVFCAGATVTSVGGIPDCSTASSGTVDFPQLFSPTQTATATSQMAASTNAVSGYNITVNGTTLTSVSSTITNNASATAILHGASQFGINLKANTTTGIGSEVFPASNTINYRGEAINGYDTAENFKFNDGDSVADSSYTSPGGSDAQIYTVSYIVDVPGSQPAGTYTTILTYICTPTF